MRFKIFLIIIFTFLFQLKSYAFEITNYTVSITGIFHDVTVAFSDLNKSGRVRCVIKKDGKPVAMADRYIRGVGTIKIKTPGITGTVASCQEL